MPSPYEKLFQELTVLLSDQQVRNSIDPQLGNRVQAIIQKEMQHRNILSSQEQKNAAQTILQGKPIQTPKNSGKIISNCSKIKRIATSKSEEKILTYHLQRIDKITSANPIPAKQLRLFPQEKFIPKESRSKDRLDRIRNKENKENKKGKMERSLSVKSQSKLKMLKTECSTSKLTSYGTNASHTTNLSQLSSKEVQFLQGITEKQRIASGERALLERRIAQFKKNIEKELAFRERIDSSINLLHNTIDSLKQKTRDVTHDQLHSQKRKENDANQSKYFTSSLQKTQHQNEQILNSIQEERELIGMYELVIEQMKKQIKIQKIERNAVRKKLTFLKKQEQAIRGREQFAALSSHRIMENIQASMDKWA